MTIKELFFKKAARELLPYIIASDTFTKIELARNSKIDYTTLDKFISKLCDANILTKTRAHQDGRRLIYSINDAYAARLLELTRIISTMEQEEK